MQLPRKTPMRVADLTLQRQVSQSDKAASPYLHLAFTPPLGTTRIDLELTYPQSETCVVDLGLGDARLTDYPSPAGLRGWSGGARRRIFVAQDGATPGYQAGEIQHGVWQVILGLYRLPEGQTPVTVDIWFDHAPRDLILPLAPSQPRRANQAGPGAGWYRGDLQCHTFHSDATGAPENLAETARREGLDFLAVTDHNTVTAQGAYFNAASSPDLIFLPAYEFTTEFGHANVFGARQVMDFRSHDPADVLAMIARIQAQGWLFSINHNKPEIPWRYPIANVDAMEVWQSVWLAGNHHALAVWQDHLAKGARIAAVGGSDFHQPGLERPENPQTLARPCTWAFCAELSEAAVLDAIRHGRTLISESPEGPRVTFAIGQATLGDTVPEMAHEVHFATIGAVGDLLEFWDTTGCIATWPVTKATGEGRLTLSPKGFLRAQIVAVASRAASIQTAVLWLLDHHDQAADWLESLDKPVLRCLTSALYVTPRAT